MKFPPWSAGQRRPTRIPNFRFQILNKEHGGNPVSHFLFPHFPFFSLLPRPDPIRSHFSVIIFLSGWPPCRFAPVQYKMDNLHQTGKHAMTSPQTPKHRTGPNSQWSTLAVHAGEDREAETPRGGRRSDLLRLDLRLFRHPGPDRLHRPEAAPRGIRPLWQPDRKDRRAEAGHSRRGRGGRAVCDRHGGRVRACCWQSSAPATSW